MFLRRVLVFFVLALVVTGPASAQNPQPYIVAEGGGSFGDGGAAPAVALGFGYLTPRNIGFEIEVSYVPDLDFGDPGLPRIAIFPPLTITSTGRIVGLQTNVIGMLPGGGTKLRAFVLAGGGVADVQQRIRVESPLLIPGIPGFPVSPEFPFGFDFRVTERRYSDTSLVLGAGAGFEYALTRRLGLGTSIRFQHVFSDPEGLNLARASVRATWRF